MLNLKNTKGQSVFEFLVFVPFLLLMLQVFMKVGGAINGSINQQKHVRGYFYYKLKNSSHFPILADLYNFKSITQVGYSAFGWSEVLIDNKPKAPCYLLRSFFGEPIDTCEENSAKAEGKSQHVRVFSVYGICGASYSVNNSGGWQHNSSVAGGCINSN